MRVAIEAASLAVSSGGLARYTSELSLALARCFPEDEFFLISDQPFQMPAGPPANLQRGGGPRNAMERRWWLWGIASEMRRLNADLVHGPDFAVPYLSPADDRAAPIDHHQVHAYRRAAEDVFGGLLGLGGDQVAEREVLGLAELQRLECGVGLPDVFGELLVGPGGGTWTVSPGKKRVSVTAGGAADAAATIEGPAASFPVWGTNREPWREAGVAIKGDDEIGMKFLDTMRII